MGWLVSHGSDQMAAVYPAAQFRKSLYRPDVIKRILAAGSTAQAVALADRQLKRPGQATQIEKILPPQVRIVAPDQRRLNVSQAALPIKAVATPSGDAPITALHLLLDGRPYSGGSGEPSAPAKPEPGGAVRQAWNVELSPGTHQITVKAETNSGYGLSDPVEAVFAPERIELPALYVLAMGISRYNEPGIRLEFPAADARQVAQVFEQTAGPLFRQVRCKTLTDAQATRRGILEGLSWLKSQATQRDVSVLFYAGHGGQDNDGVFYLLPADVNPDELTATGVSEDDLKRYCQSIPGRLVLMLDACHTGALGGDRRRALDGLTDNMVRDLVNDDYGVVVMCSSMGREYSLEDPQWGHGAFTKALTEGLLGQADFTHRRVVYLNDLDLYVSERVKELTGGKQHPVTQKPTSVRSFPLAKPTSVGSRS
jgi:hypothetical protein